MLIQVGTVIRPHGVRGQVKVRPDTDDPERFLDFASVFVGSSVDTASELEIESVSLQPTRHGLTVLLGLAGIGTREQAVQRRGDLVFARAGDLPDLGDDEWFLDDLVGLAVVSEALGQIGTVEEVLELPAHPVLSVRRSDGREALIPAVSPFVIEVNSSSGVIHVELPDGLVEP